MEDLQKTLEPFVDAVVDKVTTLSDLLIETYHKYPFRTACALLFGSWVTFRFSKRAVQIYVYKSPPIYFYNFPVFGSMFAFAVYPKEFRLQWLPKYGDLVSYNVLNMKYYKINDVQLARAVLTKAINRPELFGMGLRSVGLDPWFSASNGKNFEFRRRTFMQSLATILNKKQVSNNISKVLRDITYEHLDAKLAQADASECLWQPHACVRNVSFNVIYQSYFGKISKLDGKEFQDYSKNVDDNFKNFMEASFAAMVPKWMAHSLLGEQLQAFRISAYKLYEMMEQDFKDYVAGAAGASENKDVNESETIADYFAKQWQKGNVDAGLNLKERNMYADMALGLGAGMDTTSHAMEVGVLLLAKFPHVQERVYKELVDKCGERVQGSDAVFDLEIARECPQYRALVHEVLRISCPAPDGVIRTSTKDVRCVKIYQGSGEDTILCDFTDSEFWNSAQAREAQIGGKVLYDYVIEKNSYIEPNLVYLQTNNEKQGWNMEIDLNNWLVMTGMQEYQFVNNKNIIPFSAGRRDCPGQSLAMKELYAFFGNLLLKYKICAPNNRPQDIDFDYTFGDITFAVKTPVSVVIEYREQK